MPERKATMFAKLSERQAALYPFVPPCGATGKKIGDFVNFHGSKSPKRRIVQWADPEYHCHWGERP